MCDENARIANAIWMEVSEKVSEPKGLQEHGKSPAVVAHIHRKKKQPLNLPLNNKLLDG